MEGIHKGLVTEHNSGSSARVADTSINGPRGEEQSWQILRFGTFLLGATYIPGSAAHPTNAEIHWQEALLEQLKKSTKHKILFVPSLYTVIYSLSP